MLRTSYNKKLIYVEVYCNELHDIYVRNIFYEMIYTCNKYIQAHIVTKLNKRFLIILIRTGKQLDNCKCVTNTRFLLYEDHDCGLLICRIGHIRSKIYL